MGQYRQLVCLQCPRTASLERDRLRLARRTGRLAPRVLFAVVGMGLAGDGNPDASFPMSMPEPAKAGLPDAHQMTMAASVVGGVALGIAGY